VTKKGTTPTGRIQKSQPIEKLWTEFDSVTVRNRQSTRRVKVPLLRRITRTLVRELLHKKRFELGVFLVNEPEITQLNEEYVRHKGSTDVITLDYCEADMAGEIFVCVDEACIQAKRFRTTWQSEVVRYVVHGVLHLSGYDDHRSKERRRMKEAEDRLLAELSKRFRFGEIGSGRKSEGRRPKSEIRPTLGGDYNVETDLF
jgi:rRNA maturation RNase YbeY